MIKVNEQIGVGIFILLYFAMKPLYLNDSGTMQIADIILLLGLGSIIVKNHFLLSFKHSDSFSVFKNWVILILFQFCVNFIWSSITYDQNMNHRTLYYVFNFLAFLVCLLVYNEIGIKHLKDCLILGCLLSIAVTLLGLIIAPTGRTRSTSFFNNPNQLGYYAILLLTLMVVCDEQLTKLKRTIIIVFSFVFVIVSLSKAAILAFFLMTFIYILIGQKKTTIKTMCFQMIVLITLLLVVYFLFFSNNEVVLSNRILYEMRIRILNMQYESDSNLANGRGYARVFELGPHIMYGMGEGAYERFISKNSSEVHSTIISLLTSYGVIGLCGYLYIFKKCIGKTNAKRNLIALSGPFLYSITHNGIRNTLLWILLATMLLDDSTCANDD